MLPYAPLGFNSFAYFPCFGLDDLDSLKSTKQILCRMAFSWDLSDFFHFLLSICGSFVFVDHGSEVLSYGKPHYVLPIIHTINMNCTVDVDHDNLAEVLFVRFLHYEVTLRSQLIFAIHV